MKESDVMSLFLARRENYSVTSITHTNGRAYNVVMNGEHYSAVVLLSSFDFYELRYHIAKQAPSLVICWNHDTVLPIPVLSMRAGNLAESYDLPEEIQDVEKQRSSKIGSQVLLGMYISGMKLAQSIIHHKDFPESTRYRYLQRAKMLGKRRRGRPVASLTAKG